MSASYARIELNENIVLSSPFSPVPGTISASDTMDIIAQQSGFTVTLPDARQGSAGQRYFVRNVGDRTRFSIISTGDFEVALPPLSTYLLTLTDTDTEEGAWSIVRLSVSANNLITDINAVTDPENETAVNFESSEIEGTTVTLTLGLSDTLKGINALGENKATKAGFLIRSGEEANSAYNIRTLEAGRGIEIQNPSGVNGNPTISIESIQSNYAIGGFQFNGSELSSVSGEELQITNAENRIVIQGMRFDARGNVTSLTNEGLGRSVATSWVRFTDASDSQNPIIGQSYNVQSVREVSTGMFRIEFLRPFTTANYAVTLGMSAARPSTGSPYNIFHPRVVSVASTFVEIGVFTTGGELASGASGDISVVTFGDGDRTNTGIGT